jgi:hypothetical protein
VAFSFPDLFLAFNDELSPISTAETAYNTSASE